MSDSRRPRPDLKKPVSAVRGSVLVSSLAALRENGQFERYEALVDPLHRDDILGCLASSWISIEIVDRHYAACQALRLTPEQAQKMGEFVGQRIQGAFMSTLTRALRLSGITPWSLLDQFDRLWARLMLGGGVTVHRVGPKDAHIDVVGLSLFRYNHFCIGFSGVIRAGFRLVGTTAFRVHLADVSEDGLRAAYRAAWV